VEKIRQNFDVRQVAFLKKGRGVELPVEEIGLVPVQGLVQEANPMRGSLPARRLQALCEPFQRLLPLNASLHAPLHGAQNRRSPKRRRPPHHARNKVHRPLTHLRRRITQTQAVLDPTGPRSHRRHRQPVRLHQRLDCGDLKGFGLRRKNLHPVKAQQIGLLKRCLQSVPKNERTSGRLRNQRYSDCRLHIVRWVFRLGPLTA
jgi:hypothetical protein